MSAGHCASGLLKLLRLHEDTPAYLPQALLGLVSFPGAIKVFFIVLLDISCHELCGLLGLELLVKRHNIFVGRGAG